MSEMKIDSLDPDTPEARELIAASDAFYVDLYPAESNHLESVADLQRSNVLFVGCWLDTELVGTGGAKIMDDDGQYGEIKRVFVLDPYRGRGLSRQIMAYLENELRQHGVDLFRLETGIKQPEALALYRKLGYLERGPFGAYRADPLSVFMEKNSAAER